MNYILNSPILTNFGTYSFQKINLLKAKDILTKRKFVSAIGHESTAIFVSEILGIEIPLDRVAVKMQPGDTAIIFHLLDRLPEGKILTEEEMGKIHYEFGILEML